MNLLKNILNHKKAVHSIRIYQISLNVNHITILLPSNAVLCWGVFLLSSVSERLRFHRPLNMRHFQHRQEQLERILDI